MIPDLIHCIYVSAASRPFESSELVALLDRARTKNQRLGLTGMLLHSDGSFFQVLEGAPAEVGMLYEQIGADTRHTQVTKVIEEPIDERHFDSWTMGFSQLSRRDLASITGSNDFFGPGRSFDSINAGRAKQLLGAFREGAWRKKLAA